MSSRKGGGERRGEAKEEEEEDIKNDYNTGWRRRGGQEGRGGYVLQENVSLLRSMMPKSPYCHCMWRIFWNAQKLMNVSKK